METITLKINKKSREGKTLMDLINLFSLKKTAVQIVDEPRYNPKTEKAIAETKLRIGIIKTTSHEDLMKKLRS